MEQCSNARRDGGVGEGGRGGRRRLEQLGQVCEVLARKTESVGVGETKKRLAKARHLGSGVELKTASHGGVREEGGEIWIT